MNSSLGVLGIFALLVFFSLAQAGIGLIGIEHHLGTGWMWVALLLSVILRFTLPLTIGAFFGAVDVLHWHWALAALFAAPGLALVVPGAIAAIISAVRNR